MSALQKYNNILCFLTIVVFFFLYVPAQASDRDLQEKNNSVTASDADEIAGPARPSAEMTVEETEVEETEVEETEVEETEMVMPSSGIEGAGLYDGPAESGFGQDLWQETKRSSITELIKMMPATSRYPAIQHMIFGILLSKTQTELLENDVPLQSGQDLLTLRLQKLIEAGAYKQALNLYSSLNQEIPSEGAAKAGILAMLFTGEKSLACIEINTLPASFNNSDFFKTVGAFCEATLGKNAQSQSLDILRSSPDKLLLTMATQKDFFFNYDPETFDKFSTLEKATLVSEEALKVQSDSGGFKRIPSTHIQLLIQADTLSPKDKFYLNIRAFDRGLIRTEDLKKIYLSTINPDIRKDPELTPPENSEDWQKIPYYLQIAINKKNSAEQWKAIQNAYGFSAPYGSSALTPFAEILTQLRPTGITFKELKTTSEIFVKTGSPIPKQWIDIISEFHFKPEEVNDQIKLIAMAFLSDPDAKQIETLKSVSDQVLAQNSNLLTPFIKYIIENVDKGYWQVNNTDTIYENNLDLTLNQDYVMQSTTIWNRLPTAARQGRTGETILLSLAALKQKQLQDVHPDLFQYMLQNLSTVGLTDISRNLAIEAVLGDENFKGE